MAVNSNLNRIGFQDQLRSKPIRENYTDIETDLNDLQTQINNLVTPSSTLAEVVNARDNFTVLRDNIRERKVYGDRVSATGSYTVEAQATATNTVKVAAGDGIVNGIGVVSTASQTSGTVSGVSGASKKRRDVVVINSDNSLAIESGSEVNSTAADNWPALTSAQLPLAYIDITSTGAQVINDSDINDLRLPLINPFQEFANYDFTASYSAAGTMNTVTYTDNKGVNVSFSISYSTASLINTISTTYNGQTYTQSFTYNGTSDLTAGAITIS